MKRRNGRRLLMAGILCAAFLAGCNGGERSQTEAAQEQETSYGQKTTEQPGTQEAAVEEETMNQEMVNEEENYNTGDASLDNPRNQDGIGETELLVVSFGTSYNDNRRLTIGAIEDSLEKAFPEYGVRRGFTSQIIIDHIKNRDGEAIDNVAQALERAADNGVKTMIVQPTHLMNGLEYQDLENEVAQYSDAFQQVVIGAPLLTSEEDYEKVMGAVVEATAEYDDGETAICLMGHGTEAESNSVYEKMQETFRSAGYDNYFVGTVEAHPGLEDVLKDVQEGEYRRVVLRPLMIVAGDHANNDMAGDEEGSWKFAFEAAGYQVETVVEGLGQLPAIQELFAEDCGFSCRLSASDDIAVRVRRKRNGEGRKAAWRGDNRGGRIGMSSSGWGLFYSGRFQFLHVSGDTVQPPGRWGTDEGGDDSRRNRLFKAVYGYS